MGLFCRSSGRRKSRRPLPLPPSPIPSPAPTSSPPRFGPLPEPGFGLQTAGLQGDGGGAGGVGAAASAASLRKVDAGGRSKSSGREGGASLGLRKPFAKAVSLAIPSPSALGGDRPSLEASKSMSPPVQETERPKLTRATASFGQPSSGVRAPPSTPHTPPSLLPPPRSQQASLRRAVGQGQR